MEIVNFLKKSRRAYKNYVSRYDANMDSSERILSVVTAGMLLGSGLKGITSHPIRAVGVIAVGSALLWRAGTGYCPLKKMAGKKSKKNYTIVEHHYFI